MNRAEYLAHSLNRSQPWKAAGVSRATWYRQHVRQVQPAPVSSMPAEPVSTVVMATGRVSAQSTADAVAITSGRIFVTSLDEAFRVRAAILAEGARHEQARAARLSRWRVRG